MFFYPSLLKAPSAKKEGEREVDAVLTLRGLKWRSTLKENNLPKPHHSPVFFFLLMSRRLEEKISEYIFSKYSVIKSFTEEQTSLLLLIRTQRNKFSHPDDVRVLTSQRCTAAHKLCPHVLRAASAAAAQLFTLPPQQMLHEMANTAEPPAIQPQLLLFTLEASFQPTSTLCSGYFTLFSFSDSRLFLWADRELQFYHIQHICTNNNRHLTLMS